MTAAHLGEPPFSVCVSSFAAAWKQAYICGETPTREAFIHDHRHGLYAMQELCARYSISRKTGCKWLARYAEGGPMLPAYSVVYPCPRLLTVARLSPS
jgi:hypothetical protein